MNDLTGLKTDGRRGNLSHRWNPSKTSPKRKKHDIDEAWATEFPGVEIPHYWGCLPFEIYPKLQAAGWKFSSRYGWRKPEKKSPIQ